MAAGLEINQLELPNYLASGTCPKPPPSSGCQSGRLEEIVVVTCYRSFLSSAVQEIYGVILCDTNDYKVFGKTGKHKKDLKSNKPDSLTQDLELGLGKICSAQM